MANYNRVFLMGNLTRDPQLRYTPTQQAVCDFGLAINRKWKGPDGQMHEEVCFVDCTAWGRTAENIQKYVAKGRPLFVEGRLRYHTWDAPDGKKRSKLDVTVLAFQFIDSAKGGAGGGGPSAAAGAGRAAPTPAPSPDAKRQETSGAEEQKPPDYDFNQEVDDDTIPF
jgi:single-strand DNA-binding protein